VYHAVPLDKLIEQALHRKGFSVVEVLNPLPDFLWSQKQAANSGYNDELA